MALALAWLGGGGTKGDPIPRYGEPRTAVVVLDLQRDFLEPGGKNPIAADQVAGVLGAANAVLDAAALSGLDVVYVGNEFPPEARLANLFRRGAALRGSRGAALDPRLHTVGGPYFAKTQGDAFSTAALDAHLRARHVGRVVLAGVFGDQCVYATARGALNRGYAVTVLRDGIGAASEAARERAVRDLAGRGVRVVTSTQFLAEFPGSSPPALPLTEPRGGPREPSAG